MERSKGRLLHCSRLFASAAESIGYESENGSRSSEEDGPFSGELLKSGVSSFSVAKAQSFAISLVPIRAVTEEGKRKTRTRAEG